MNVINYQKELDKTIVSLQKEGRVPKLLLHSCCAPCSSYVLEYLSEYFEITVFYYNPNIYPEREIMRRIASTGWQRGWKMSKRGAPDALNVMRSGFGRRHRWQKKPVMIILRPHFLSVL